MGLKQEILAAREHAKSFDYHQRSKCKQNLLELMAELYGEGWDPDLEAAEQPQHPSKHPERQTVKTQPADPNFFEAGGVRHVREGGVHSPDFVCHRGIFVQQVRSPALHSQFGCV